MRLAIRVTGFPCAGVMVPARVFLAFRCLSIAAIGLLGILVGAGVESSIVGFSLHVMVVWVVGLVVGCSSAGRALFFFLCWVLLGDSWQFCGGLRTHGPKAAAVSIARW